MDSFESLLLEKENKLNPRIIPGKNDGVIANVITEDKPVGLLKSDQTMDLFEFIQKVEKLVTIAMKELNVVFIPDENKVPIDNPDIKVDYPIITYKIIKREIKDKEGLKPRVREEILENPDDPNNSRCGQIFGQKFQSIIQFDIFASVYDVAEQVMKKFEELLFVYTGPLKKRGLGELLFKEQLTDENLDQYRQTISVRSLRYYVETENVYVTFRNKIEEINIFGS